MRFCNEAECKKWLADRARSKPDENPDLCSVQLDYPKEPHRIFSMANWLAQSITFSQPALLWITEYGVLPSSENWHLYYRLRNSYGDHQLLQESPGHLFLGTQSEDLASFAQIAMLNGWGGCIVTEAGHVDAAFSHDEWIQVYAKSPDLLIGFRKFFTETQNPPTAGNS